jgi:hypothetical protein
MGWGAFKAGDHHANGAVSQSFPVRELISRKKSVSDQMRACLRRLSGPHKTLANGRDGRHYRGRD